MRILRSVSLAMLLVVGGSAQSSPDNFSREAMLRNIASNVLARGWEDLSTKCRALTNAVAQLAQSPNAETLNRARSAWLATDETTSRLRCFQAGPLATRNFSSTFYYWQILPPRIDGIINSTEAIDQSFMDQLGAATKGLSAIEYLLFERGDLAPDERAKAAPALELFSRTNSQRRAVFLLALARDLEAKATQLAADWNAPGEQGASAKFVGAGQESVNLLVNQLASGAEYEAERHLHFVLVLPTPISRQLYRVERVRSGSSLDGVVAGLEGLQKMYRGADDLGLDDALKHVNAPLAKRVEDQFQAALAATRAIGTPLDQAVVNNRASIEAAYEKARALEILIKVDLASALGVTLTFSSNDGD